MTTAPAPAAPPLVLNGVRPGDPCWIVPPAKLPVRVAAAVLVRYPSGPVLLHDDGTVYHAGSVFATEAEAVAEARRSAGWYAAYHRRQLAAVEDVLRELDGRGKDGA